MLNVPKCDGTCSLPTPGRWVVNVVAKLWEAWELNNEKGARGFYLRGSVLWANLCYSPGLVISHSSYVRGLRLCLLWFFTPTSVQKRRGTKETLPLLLALANRGDAGVLAAFLGQTLDKSPYPSYHNTNTWGFAVG